MKGVFVACFLFLCIPLAAQTYYYERVKIVRNGQVSVDAGDGHYITFNDNGCYDSNKQGMSSGTGFRNYKSFENGIYKYFGKSYFGGDAYYFFSQDRGRLNIKMQEGDVVYVYERKTAPSVMGPSVRGYRSPSSSDNVGAVPVVVPATPVMPATPNVAPSASSRVYVDHTCRGCHGSGYCTCCHGTGKIRITNSIPEYHVTYVDCKSCRGTGKCQVCYGKGRID
ncbi:MAG: hypothetical protein J5871_02500 [Bacteroidales bacterium]|nr:hypothetical protein [Bacteroidales bacterium]